MGLCELVVMSVMYTVIVLHYIVSSYTVLYINVCVCVCLQAGQDFHADLYPDTAGQTAAMSAEEWWAGENKEVLELRYGSVCAGPVLVSLSSV